MKILFKLTSRSRPEKFFATIKNIFDHCTGKDFFILCTADTDDETMAEAGIEVWNMYGEEKIMVLYGTSAGKVDAINRDMDDLNYDWDILINMSDDMVFTVKGFDEVIRKAMADNFPDTDGVLHFNDGFTDDKVMTLSILGRKYYERFGYIYHPDYKSVYCDNEATEVAKILKCYKYFPEVLYNHNHPAWGRAPMDDQYIKTESFYNEDKATYEERKAMNFELIPV